MHLLLPKLSLLSAKNILHCSRFILIACGALALSACASGGGQYNPASVESRDLIDGGAGGNGCIGRQCPDQGDVATSLPRENIALERARYFEAEAERRSNSNAQIDATLNAAEYYVQVEKSSQAVGLLSDLRQSTSLAGLTDVQRDRIDVVYAYHAYSNRDYRRALSILDRLRPIEQTVEFVDPRTLPEFQERLEQQEQLRLEQQEQAAQSQEYSYQESRDPANAYPGPAAQERMVIEQPRLSESLPLSSQQVDALLLSSFCYREMGQYDQQINALILRERGLSGEARAQSTRYTWQVINALTEFDREQIIEQSGLSSIKPRLEQSLMGRTGVQIDRVKQFTSLPRDLNNPEITQRQPIEWTSNSIGQIAVLLPLSSKFNKAATALLDGIKFEHELQRGAYSPELLVYDIGENAYQTAQYYQAAVNQGAEFIIGPLGKDFADQLLLARSQYNLRSTPALLLGGSAALGGDTFRFEFSPERQGIMAARKAYADGHLSAGLIVANDPKSARIKQAFEQEWLNLGGRITAQTQYSAAQFDHTVELQLLFRVGASENRAKQLETTLGYKPKHAAYQRADIDFIFMISDAQTGRLLRPQINYFSASRIPVYAGLDVYTGVADAINDMDLEETNFPVMPWILRSEQVSQYAGQFNQLFALGADAYRVASQYDKYTQHLNLSSNQVIEGYTGLLRLHSNGNIESEPLWARFNEGLAQVDDSRGFDLTPIGAAEDVDEDLLQSRLDGTQRSGVNQQDQRLSTPESTDEPTSRNEFERSR